MSKQLCEPVLENGIKNTNFFNGRLLAAEDLQDEQLAQRRRHQQLGQAIGGGVVRGLEVSLKSSGVAGAAVVTVGGGLAINGSGLALSLPGAIEVVLAPEPDAAAQAAGQFADCDTERLATFPTGAGVYVLLLGPAAGYAEQAPMSGLGANGKITSCGRKYAVDGVAFRLAKLTLADVLDEDSSLLADLKTLMQQTNNAGNLATDAADLSMLRNLLAHLCYGSETLALAPRDLFARQDGRSLYAEYGAIDALLAKGRLSADEVPLALVYWTASGLRFVDMWAVRRRPAAPFGVDPWGVFLSDWRLREAEAMLLQFEDQVQQLLDRSPTPAAIVAADYFRYLPPAGMLPVSGAGSLTGFDPDRFFGDHASRSLAITDGKLVRGLMHEALYHEPINLSEEGKIQRYLIWENTQAVEQGNADQLTLLFAGQALPYRGVARFAHAPWGLSRFVPAVI